MINDENKDFAGKNGFIWFTGIVEDRQDPIKLGRVRVRCVGWHAENKMLLPTDMLPWAIVAFPTNNTNPYAPKEGDMVFGFFGDGESAQAPIVVGVFPAIPLKAGNAQEAFSDSRDAGQLASAPVKPSESATLYPRRLDEPTTSRLARNDSDYPSPINQSKAANKASKVEPNSYYNAVYPYNNVYESESGHALEFDDTKGAERIHLYHRSGSYVEYGPEGDRAERIQRDKFTVVVGDDSVYVQGDVKLYVDGNVTAEIGGNLQATISGNATADVNGNLQASIGGNVTADVGGQADMTVGGNINATAPNLNLNGNLNVTGQATVSKNILVGQGITTGTGGGGGNMTVNGSATFTGDVVAQGTSLKTHTHSGVQSGGSNTGPPN